MARKIRKYSNWGAGDIVATIESNGGVYDGWTRLYTIRGNKVYFQNSNYNVAFTVRGAYVYNGESNNDVIFYLDGNKLRSGGSCYGNIMYVID